MESLLAQLGLPDMRLPIQIALLHPEKLGHENPPAQSDGDSRV